MVAFLWKPFSEGGLNPGGTSVLLGGIRGGVQSVGVYDSQGNLLENLAQSNSTELGTKFYSRRPGNAFGDNLTVKVTYSNGKTEDYSIPSGGQRFEGPLGDANPGASGGGPGNTGPGGPFPPNTTGYGAYPYYLGNQFPSPSLINYNPIEAAPYNFTDVMEFAKKYAPFAREELVKNNALAKEFAFDQLNTELEGLRGFVPASAALKRRETSLDNQFNLMERNRLVDQGLPGARADLEGQRGRANTFAEGGVPEAIGDKALSLSLSSRAADRASSAGLGGGSQSSRKAQDLLNVQQRIQLSQYGDQLLGQNIQSRSQLFLPPTEYSDAGSQIRVMPSLSGSQLQGQARQELTQQTSVPATQALSTTVQQEQYRTSLEQQTRMFNTTNQLATDQFNANNINTFALKKFDYDVSYAGAQAGATQTDINTQTALQQQQQYADLFKQFFDEAQKSGNASALGQLGGALIGLLALLGAGSSISSIFSAIASQLGYGKKPAGGGGSGKRPPSGGTDGTGTTPPPDDNDNEDTNASPPDNSGTDTGTTPNPDNPDATVDVDGDGVGDVEPDAPRPPEQADPVEDTGPVDSSTPEDLGQERAAFRSFQKDTGINLRSLPIEDQQRVQQSARSVQQSAGIFENEVQGTQFAGYGLDGKARYSAKALVNKPVPPGGSHIVDAVQTFLDPFGILSDKDVSTLQGIKNAANSLSFIAQLDSAYKRGDTKGFITAIASKFNQPIVQDLEGINPALAHGYDTAFSAYKLFSSWGTASPAQKAFGLEALGVKGYKFATGKNLGDELLIKPVYKVDGAGNQVLGKDGKPVLDQPGFSVGQALAIANAGINVYDLFTNWDKYNTLNKIVSGSQTVSSVIHAAQSLGYLKGGGAGGTAAASGGTATASGGAGGAGAAELSGLEAAGVFAQGVAGAGAIYIGAKTIYDGWGKGGAEGRKEGAIGGAEAAGGYLLLTSALAEAGVAGATTGNYYVAAAVFAGAIVGGSVKTGKHKDQVGRDRVRDFYQKNGLADKDYQVSLADGSTFDIGIDGSGGRHEVAHPELLTKQDAGRAKKGLSAYDVDYTNDLDYSSALAGISLSRLLAGGKAKNVDQLGSQLANAGLGNVGYGKEFTPENFEKVMANQRAFFAKAGIKDKAEAFLLAEQGYKEGRWDDFDYAGMIQSFNMMYDKNGYSQAQKLMGGRFKGIDVAQNSNPGPGDTEKDPGKIPPGSAVDAANRNPSLVKMTQPSSKQGNVEVVGPTSIPGYDGTYKGVRIMPKELEAPPAPQMIPAMQAYLSKEELRKRNREKYASDMGNV